MSSTFSNALAIYGIAAIAVWFISLYIIRAIFNIPTIVRMHKAQLKLLEQIAKAQGVDDTKVKTIISESVGWDGI